MPVDHDYNLNAVTEIEVTEDFLSLGIKTTECQNDESFEDCVTREYTSTLLQECKCLPFEILMMKNKV